LDSLRITVITPPSLFYEDGSDNREKAILGISTN